LKRQGTGDYLPNPFSFNLTDLSDGKHSLEVTATAKLGWTKTGSSGIIYFTVDTTAPKVQFAPSQQQSFASGADASFNFTAVELFEGISWVGYSLDGKAVVAVTDNVTSTVTARRYNYQLTLDGLSDGAHDLTVYAGDLAGNVGASAPLQFTVGQEAQPEPDQSASDQLFPTALIASAIALVAVVGIGLLVYFSKKRRMQ
jgi:hypothetical protein